MLVFLFDPTTRAVNLQVMAKVIDENNLIQELMTALEGKGREALAFIVTLSDHKESISKSYESMRLASASTAPNMDLFLKGGVRASCDVLSKIYFLG